MGRGEELKVAQAYTWNLEDATPLIDTQNHGRHIELEVPAHHLSCGDYILSK